MIDILKVICNVKIILLESVFVNKYLTTTSASRLSAGVGLTSYIPVIRI